MNPQPSILSTTSFPSEQSGFVSVVTYIDAIVTFLLWSLELAELLNQQSMIYSVQNLMFFRIYLCISVTKLRGCLRKRFRKE